MSNPDLTATSAELSNSPQKFAIFTGYSAAVTIAILYFAMAVSAVRDKSVTFDEIAHIASGYSYWSQNDYRLQPENGILPQRWAAIPLQFSDLKFVDTQHDVGWLVSESFIVGEDFFYKLGNNVDSILLRSRAMIAILGAITSLVVYVWARHLFGKIAGMIAIILFAFSPNMLAHGSLATSDMAATLFFLASTGSVWILLHRISFRMIFLAAVSLAGLALSKFSAPLVFFMIVMMVVVRFLVGRPLIIELPSRESKSFFKPTPRIITARYSQAGAIVLAGLAACLIVWIVIWAAYGFRYQTFNHFTPGRDLLHDDFEALYPKMTGLTEAAVRFARSHELLPEAFLLGFSYVEANAVTRQAFLAGEYSIRGWPYFFPYAFLIKTPLALFGILLLSMCWAVHWSRRRNFSAAYALVPLFCLLVVYWIAAMLAHLNIGDRHILPIYPPTIILAAGAARWIGRNRAFTGVLAALLAWFVIDSILIRPNYLAYFNPLVGGPKHAYRYLVDSSLDWGQDLPSLKKWIDHNVGSTAPRPRVYVSYFGTGSVKYYDIDAILLPSILYNDPPTLAKMTGGIYCISATMLESLYTEAWGPWSPIYEDNYQTFRKEREQWDHATPEQRDEWIKKYGKDFFHKRFKYYNELRLNRLCAYLRTREPDDNVGHSILIFKLTDDEVRKALDGPPPAG